MKSKRIECDLRTDIFGDLSLSSVSQGVNIYMHDFALLDDSSGILSTKEKYPLSK